jgi:RimJ/RimL family protein N-acetyltransferase
VWRLRETAKLKERSMSELSLRAPKRLRDDAIELRLLSAEDAPAFLDALRDPAVAHYAYSDRLAPDETTVEQYIARVPDGVSDNDAVTLAVVNARTGAFLGSTILFNVDPDACIAELGFWVSPGSRGGGLAARAIRLTGRWAFDELGLERMQGLTDVENEAAQRAMERAGFAREGILRGVERRPEGRVDLVSYSVLFTDNIDHQAQATTNRPMS